MAEASCMLQNVSGLASQGVAQLAAKSSGADADATCSYAVAAVDWSAAVQPAASVAQAWPVSTRTDVNRKVSWVMLLVYALCG